MSENSSESSRSHFKEPESLNVDNGIFDKNSYIKRSRLLKIRQNSNQSDFIEDAENQIPLAIVQGEEITQAPVDLYIPPSALEIFLDAFEGPLDLLLYLIKKQNLDILEINVAELTEQYMQYVNLMNALQFDLAAEYLVMSAMLAEIKSRMLLPRSKDIEEDDEDPRDN